MIQPSLDMFIFPIIERITFHGYVSYGVCHLWSWWSLCQVWKFHLVSILYWLREWCRASHIQTAIESQISVQQSELIFWTFFLTLGVDRYQHLHIFVAWLNKWPDTNSVWSLLQHWRFSTLGFFKVIKSFGRRILLICVLCSMQCPKYGSSSIFSKLQEIPNVVV